ncbi:S66 family peptidase [Staphylococcus edaphicus]|uniref:LD-carboxypeptidase n=1 Tax=Staphylococcus edaphicus TaxID=1955013 RepID=A0A2C6WKS5_9STAP|nr:S66 peptidase family protein [Staphylococcus edaphicus]PHK48969.1 LD-carboxypeptidase [Staphylococcus edaphicus]UQW80556.1 LD-carboxypeptidase [Staphylococcus edaphicus]
MIKPKRLLRGDTVAIVSLSSGLAGEPEILWRTYQGIERLKRVFALNVKVMPNALKGKGYIQNHPEARAADLNAALKDPEIKAIISCIGGEDSIEILPFVDLEAIRQHPKIFSGYSDSTTIHMMFYKMGIVSFYGPALLTDFAENIEMDDYTVKDIEKFWFNCKKIGNIAPAEYIRPYGLSWNIENKMTARQIIQQHGYELIQGQGIKQGQLIGGNLETLVSLINTSLFPNKKDFEDAIIFLETSEDTPTPPAFEDMLVTLIQQDILSQCNGLVIGKPFNNIYYEAYKERILNVLKRYKLIDIPVLYNMSFGHNEPKHTVPYGLQAEINCYSKQFLIKESAVQCT